jgi:hypothetical protein
VACKFVIGGGKKTRQKYDPEMLKHFTVALSAAGLRVHGSRFRFWVLGLSLRFRV